MEPISQIILISIRSLHIYINILCLNKEVLSITAALKKFKGHTNILSKKMSIVH